MAPDPQKREARRFEPPPWERDRFEELEKRRGEDAEPEEGWEAQEAGTSAPTEERAGVDEQPPEAQQLEQESRQERKVGSEPGQTEGEALGEVGAMLLALKAEEPDALEGAWKFGAAASVFVTTIGLMLVVWGSVAMARAASSGAAGVMGSAIMSVMGALFAALGVWLGVRSLRQRGVL